MSLLIATRTRSRSLLVVVLAVVAAAVTPATAAARVSGAKVARYAETYVGVPYEWGASGPRAFDCSGLVQAVYAHFGIDLTRTSYAQMLEGTAVRRGLRRGDLVFWNHGGHVGIYVGRRRFVSATVHAGVAVYSMSVWARTQTYAGARRIVGAVGQGRPVATPRIVAGVGVGPGSSAPPPQPATGGSPAPG